MKLGIKITKIHKILTFDEKPFLKEYIDLNTNLRIKKAKINWKKIYLNWWIMLSSENQWKTY